ncbi:MAG: hypothetical protein MJ233_04990 [Mycoplasmoidaceae bacterium]|nr:hypothetical protein [Mycoplasmoidaceae bacterium]
MGRVDGINTSIHSLENLVLPARSVGVIGYGDMFYGNTNIVSGPRICARYVAKESFGCMFEDNACLQNVYIEYTGKLFDSDSDEIGFVR